MSGRHEAAAAPLGAGEAARRILASAERGEAVVEAVLLEAPKGAEEEAERGASPPGARLLIWADRAEGTLGEPALDRAAAERARALLAEPGAAPGRTLELDTARGPAAVYLEPHRPADRLIVVGAGHIARPLCRLGALLGYRVAVLDDRPEFATRERFPRAERVLRVDFSDPFRDVPLDAGAHLVLVTRGHKFDYDALLHALRTEPPPAYVGMVGSRRRVRAALEQLAQESVDPARLASVHAPIGLDIGAETPEEIAVAIAAELVLVRRGGSGRPLRAVERVVERWVEGPLRRPGDRRQAEGDTG